jgi:hypothetical protein
MSVISAVHPFIHITPNQVYCITPVNNPDGKPWKRKNDGICTVLDTIPRYRCEKTTISYKKKQWRPPSKKKNKGKKLSPRKRNACHTVSTALMQSIAVRKRSTVTFPAFERRSGTGESLLEK